MLRHFIHVAKQYFVSFSPDVTTAGSARCPPRPLSRSVRDRVTVRVRLRVSVTVGTG